MSDRYFLGQPKPLFSLSWVELWERFSFYGIRPLLILFMIATIQNGGLAFDRADAAAIVGIFAGFIYLVALPGGWLADCWLGQKNAILFGALIMSLGHLFIGLSVFWHFMFFLGLVFIVLGSGLFKTCASVMVGMLYKDGDARRDSGFIIFYMGINLGAFVAPLLCGLVQKQYGWHWGFGIGGLGMLISLIIFYFKAIPDFNDFDRKFGLDKSWSSPNTKVKNIGLYVGIALALLFAFIFACGVGWVKINPVWVAKNMVFLISACAILYFIYLYFFNTHIQKHEKKNLIVFVVCFVAAVFFWSNLEQSPTSFNLFAADFTNRMVFGWEIPITWFQSLNPLFIIIFAPIISMIWIFLANKGWEIHSLSKFTLGMIGAGIGFGVMFFAARLVISAGMVSPWWLVVGIWFMTMGELCLSPVGLSIMTQIAPKAIKGQVMGLWFVASSLGNVVAGLIGGGVKVDKIEALPDLFAQCAYMLFGIALLLFLIKGPIIRMLKNS
ncbi:peptide MFS transporter [Helicobacter mustelae]|uniref:Putative oligopeptide transporter (Major facilitator superfamily protein) n=1 Tax=Helicobacter mustelae (strain ATCC 43772 / CCUG 25715 / CIP 103759 / LMG 18044 / NCTC 12198 / R85-136P) TaxID=679897 RepID=D3UHA0_HELM1|nr:peptide MFS transporter [Helicobacter mustelae]CBG39872.1 putative oligopeptide transporter (major facilitator superfamily protein) [Helicobacter mustelae 12198]SQH71382.1 major facilitator superfamily oligopeptide transporter [Helicobacter mustelae]STP12510.1 major facilitator superfamily oligopeptide transporter [Helicobacter mustelae]